MKNFDSYLIKAGKLLLFITAFTPLIVTRNVVFPFIFGKMVFFRGAVELALAFFLIGIAVQFLQRSQYVKQREKEQENTRKSTYFQNPIVISAVLFLLSFAVSTLFAVNQYRSFWGDVERAEGFFGILHYVVFFFLALAVFQKKDWFLFFKISLGVGFVVALYTFFEYFGIQNIPFSFHPTDRPNSFIGNSSFLAAYLLFVIMFAFIVLLENRESRVKTFWRYFSSFMAVFSAAAIFLTATRGAIVGLSVGIFVFLAFVSFRKRVSLPGNGSSFPFQSAARVALGAAVVFSAVFFATRSAALWQYIPGLNRLAETAVLDVRDASTQTRLLTWQLSWEAMKERPVFGWGAENYLVAYLKHFNPELHDYGETWMDRAHNIFFDTGVMRGFFGIVVYAIFLFFIFRTLLPNKHIGRENNRNVFLRFALTAGFAAYIAQNMFVFDTLTSYVPFFALAGFIVVFFGEKRERTGKGESDGNISTSDVPRLALRLRAHLTSFILNMIKRVGSFLAIPAALLALYAVYAYNYTPYVQARAFRDSTLLERAEDVVPKLKRAMYPYNFAQINIRGSGVDEYYLNQFFYNIKILTDPRSRPISELLIAAQEEIIAREPYDSRLAIREAEILTALAKQDSEAEAIKKHKRAEELLRGALTFAPNRPELYYHLSFALAGQGRFEESLETARYALSLNPDNYRANYQLALMLSIAGKDEEAKQKLAYVEEGNPEFNGFFPADMRNLIVLYGSWGEMDKFGDLILKSLAPGKRWGIDRQYYEIALRQFALDRNAEAFIAVAEYLTRFKDIADEMEVLIDLAKKGNWGIIEKL